MKRKIFVLITISMSFVSGAAFVSLFSDNGNSTATAATQAATPAPIAGTQIFCSSKLGGALSISREALCDSNTQDPFTFTNVGQTGSNGFLSKSICGVTGKSLCVVGSLGPAGGTIFYVDLDNQYQGFTYLEAAPAGWYNEGSSLHDPVLIWCNDVNHRIQGSSDPWTKRVVGNGRSNTELMKVSCKSGVATAVSTYNASKKTKATDWFIPSLGELILMAENLQGHPSLSAEDYWSSSEFSDVGGWVEAVGHGYQGNATKSTTFHVHPIRSF
jgi:hypothetical protein